MRVQISQTVYDVTHYLGITNGYQLVRAYAAACEAAAVVREDEPVCNTGQLLPMIYYRQEQLGRGKARPGGWVTFSPEHWLYLEPEHDKFLPVWLKEDRDPLRLQAIAAAAERYEEAHTWHPVSLHEMSCWVPNQVKNWMRRELTKARQAELAAVAS